MNKYDIPSKVRIANHWYKVTLCDFIDDGDIFGSHCNLTLEIKVAESFNYYYNNKQDESLAQVFANFMREFELTRE